MGFPGYFLIVQGLPSMQPVRDTRLVSVGPGPWLQPPVRFVAYCLKINADSNPLKFDLLFERLPYSRTVFPARDIDVDFDGDGPWAGNCTG